MFAKWICVVLFSSLLFAPLSVSLADESAEEIEMILSWWNEYGKYWKAAEAQAESDSLSIASKESSE